MSDDWQNRAECRSVDPGLMQPEVASVEDVEAAKAVCAGCPVIDQCAELAGTMPDAFGVWAGQWLGPAPVDPSTGRCEWCGEAASAGARYCGGAHRVAAHRARNKLPA